MAIDRKRHQAPPLLKTGGGVFGSLKDQIATLPLSFGGLGVPTIPSFLSTGKDHWPCVLLDVSLGDQVPFHLEVQEVRPVLAALVRDFDMTPGKDRLPTEKAFGGRTSSDARARRRDDARDAGNIRNT